MEQKTIKSYHPIIKNINENDFTASVIVSTKSVDRDGDIVPPEAFKKRLKEYKAHPILVSSHNYFSLTKQIGEAKSVKITEDGLEVKFEWYVNKGNPEADWGWVLAQKGVAGFSIGFIPFKWEDGEIVDGQYKDGIRRKFTDVELIEVSQVLIPSNRDAVMNRRGKEDGITAEVMELAIKNFGWEEQAEKKENDDESEEQPAPDADKEKSASSALAKEIILDSIKKSWPEFTALVKQAVDEILKEKTPPEGNPGDSKNYIDALLTGKGANVPEPVPTQESIMEMVRSVAQKSIK